MSVSAMDEFLQVRQGDLKVFLAFKVFSESAYEIEDFPYSGIIGLSKKN